ncbi:hypothetical protein HPB48_020338 [Haemaphysalis longicornis]|uniref:CCHC-type domain-containing protein n=1 Tax=Haemaphysalis longicornis TaxID=44386 RepID=A0A9J6GNV8_HAELO|nr:hypothetical protein HPB48_020338 [Haemaphysalis longicornis]
MESKQYEVTAYIAVPDNSSKGIIMGIAANTTTDELVEHLRSPNAEIIHARMMGNSTTALLTFAGLRVPRYVNYYGGEYRCRVFQPRHQTCRICRKLGHRADVCPSPDTHRCSACGTVNPVPGHVCVPRCASCHADHPATDPRCPDRQRRPYNKTHVLRSLASTNRSPPFFPPATTQQCNTTDCTGEAVAHQTQGSLQSCATTERPLADSELPSTECVRAAAAKAATGDAGTEAGQRATANPGYQDAARRAANAAETKLHLTSGRRAPTSR